MPDAVTAEKIPLKVTRCKVDRSGKVSLESVTFEALLNPGEVVHGYSISYNQSETLGQMGSDTRFSAVGPDSLSFSLVLDGTGVVPDAKRRDVKTQLSELSKVVHQYVGQRHEPSQVRVLWGTVIFFGRMTTMSTQYTLFKPSGDPLRAKVKLAFTGFMSKKEMELVSNRSSPDLSHGVVVKEGDTLPLLCNAIYGDPRYYVDVARVNNLSDFRKLTPGSQLHFPPLE